MAGVLVQRLMRAFSGFAALIALLAALVFSASIANAQQPASWRISSASGTVRVTEPGRLPVPAQVGAVVKDRAIIATGPDGSATIVGPHGRLSVSPNSRVTLKRDAQGFSRVLQDAGSILYSIDKRAARHFQVDAPLMTAVVKGTSFTVLVTSFGNSVTVTEGLVEVRARRGSAARDISAGMMAWVLRATPTIVNESLVVGGLDLSAPEAATDQTLRTGDGAAADLRPQAGARSSGAGATAQSGNGAQTGSEQSPTTSAPNAPAKGDLRPGGEVGSTRTDDDAGRRETQMRTGWTVGGPDRNVALLAGILCIVALIGFAPLITAQIRGKALADSNYETLSRHGSIEVRRYDPAVTAEASATGERAEALRESLTALSVYAAGGNTESVRMTMPPPFSQSRSGGLWTVGFLIARHAGVDAAPAPRSPRVRLRFQPARTIVAMPTGASTSRGLEHAAETLKTWATRQGYQVVGAPAYAFHGPLWLPPFLRRTEILIGVRTRSDEAGKARAL